MMYNIDDMREKLLKATSNDPSYTMDDFNKEFLNNSLLKSSRNSLYNDAFKIKLYFENFSDHKNPNYETLGASGFDLRANIKESIHLKFGERALVPTGLKFIIPTGFEIQIRPRSGLAFKKGITVLNSPGTIDSDYRGEVCVLLINLGSETVTIENGERIAQGVLTNVGSSMIVSLEQVNSVSNDTLRGENGFGSTGNK